MSLGFAPLARVVVQNHKKAVDDHFAEKLPQIRAIYERILAAVGPDLLLRDFCLAPNGTDRLRRRLSKSVSGSRPDR
jgi:hypothetical protein